MVNLLQICMALNSYKLSYVVENHFSNMPFVSVRAQITVRYSKEAAIFKTANGVWISGDVRSGYFRKHKYHKFL